jgi:hypothetical protein
VPKKDGIYLRKVQFADIEDLSHEIKFRLQAKHVHHTQIAEYLMKQYVSNQQIKLREVKVMIQRRFRLEEDEALLLSRYLAEKNEAGP